jgi:hypothetical protein
MHAFAQDLDLALREDKEFTAVLAFHQQLVAERNLLGLEPGRHANQHRVGEPRKQRDAAQRLGGERSRPAGNVHPDPRGLAQFDLRAVHAISAAIDLHPGQQAEQPPGRDRHHLRRRLRRVRQVAGDGRRDASLQ